MAQIMLRKSPARHFTLPSVQEKDDWRESKLQLRFVLWGDFWGCSRILGNIALLLLDSIILLLCSYDIPFFYSKTNPVLPSENALCFATSCQRATK
jgi:hypothetical protein